VEKGLAMNEVAMLEYSLDELSRVVAALDDAEMTP
jgi:hypothetical protein